MANFVQLYKSTDTGAPTLTGQTNSMIALLNAVLVNGYSTASVTSITNVGTLATVTLAVSNATLVSGNYVKISGATGGDAALYNGTFLITVLSGTQFTYVMGGTPSGSATGTLLYNKAGLGWSSPYTGTNAAVYRSLDNTSNQFYCQVIDNAATAGGSKEAQLMGFEAMTAYNTGARQFPNTTQAASGLSIRKSATADGTTRAWTLIGDDRTFYFVANTGDAGPYHQFAFGHFIPYKTNDAYNTFIAGENLFNSAVGNSYLTWNATTFTGAVTSVNAARPYTQLATTPPPCILTTGMLPSSSNCVGAIGIMAAPNAPDSGYYVAPVNIVESYAASYNWRGRLPGFYFPLQANPINNYETMTNVTGLSGITLTGLSVNETGINNTVGLVLVDTFGPWT